jgi:hypothetical protein
MQFFIIYVPSQQLQGQLQTQHSVDTIIIIESNNVLTIMIIQFNSLFLCAKSTATRPIRDTAQHRNIIIIIKYNNSRQYVK